MGSYIFACTCSEAVAFPQHTGAYQAIEKRETIVVRDRVLEDPSEFEVVRNKYRLTGSVDDKNLKTSGNLESGRFLNT